MTKRTILVWAILSLFPILAWPDAAAGDPIRVTSGHLVMTGTLGSMELAGERGFSLSARVDAFSGIFRPWNDCSIPECTPGSVVSLHAFWSGTDIRGGLLTFEGESYRVREGEAAVGVDFQGFFVAPPLGPSAVITAPFTLVPFTLPMGGSQFSLPYPGPALVPFAGSGTATITLSPQAVFPNAWRVDSVRYEFDPVPEPGTMLMVGLGIAGAARRMSRRRHGV